MTCQKTLRNPKNNNPGLKALRNNSNESLLIKLHLLKINGYILNHIFWFRFYSINPLTSPKRPQFQFLSFCIKFVPLMGNVWVNFPQLPEKHDYSETRELSNLIVGPVLLPLKVNRLIRAFISL